MATSEVTNRYSGIGPAEVRQLEERYLFPTYKRQGLHVSHGAGSTVYDVEGREYLDMLGGIAVSALGYSHPRMTRVLMDQGSRMIHCSNLFYHPFQGLLAKRLVEAAGMSRAFFTNSGTEAIEAALKIVRSYSRRQGTPDKLRVLSVRNAFHGRTFGALSLTAQEKYQAPFRPLVADVDCIEGTTVPALERAFDDRTCAVFLETIQGEGGIVPQPAEFLAAARRLCDRHGALLVLDEIQCGMGRTGKFFAYQHYGIQPDVVTLAKALAGGYPLGAVLGNSRVAEALGPGDHGTTFGGGPLACRLALEFLDVVEEEGLLARVEELGSYLQNGLRTLSTAHPSIREVRGMGLMVGAEMGAIAKTVVERLLHRGVIANAAHETVLRLLPPFVITPAEIDRFLAILDKVLNEVEAEASAQAPPDGRGA
jgi:acetylornithine/N-succinyldiaminopimelate aminotransferase